MLDRFCRNPSYDIAIWDIANNRRPIPDNYIGPYLQFVSNSTIESATKGITFFVYPLLWCPPSMHNLTQFLHYMQYAPAHPILYRHQLRYLIGTSSNGKIGRYFYIITYLNSTYMRKPFKFKIAIISHTKNRLLRLPPQVVFCYYFQL